MDALPDNCVDAVICDLPYGTTKCSWDVVIPFPSLWYRYNRIVKPGGAVVLFGTQPFTTTMIQSNLKNFKYCWVWDKVKPIGHLVVEIRPMQQTEDICVFGKGRIKYNPQFVPYDVPITTRETSRTTIMGGKQTNDNYHTLTHKQPRNLLRFPKETGPHPTQKPVKLLEYLVKTYTDRDDIVLDNCIGSGTTAIACRNLGRHWIGIENNPEYVKMAEERIQNYLLELVNVF